MTLKTTAACKHISLCLVFASSALVSFKSHSYVTFNGTPTEDWETILEESKVDRVYRVQKTDNLHDISKTLFGDSSFWPKIWSINSGVTNPHLIEKGSVIYFSGGSQIEPPTFGLNAIDSKTYTYGNGFIEPKLPPAKLDKGVTPIPKAFKNFFTYSGNDEDERKLVESISANERLALKQKRKIQITSELTSKRPKSLGRVLRVESGGTIAMPGSLIVVKFKASETPNLGDQFTAYNYNSIGFFGESKKSVDVGIIKWVGTLKVVGRLKKNEFFAQVVDSNDFLSVGSKLSKSSIETIELPNRLPKINEDSRVNSKVKIVGAENSSELEVIGENSVVYIKGGVNKGLEKNKIYPIFENFGVGILQNNKPFKPKSIGYIKIAKVSERFATGVVFNLSSNVKDGSLLGQID